MSSDFALGDFCGCFWRWNAWCNANLTLQSPPSASAAARALSWSRASLPHTTFLCALQIQTGKQSWAQRTVTITAPSRGCHLITSEIVRQMPELREFKVGMANVFLKHTSASITLNENVRYSSQMYRSSSRDLRMLASELLHCTCTSLRYAELLDASHFVVFDDKCPSGTPPLLSISFV